MFISVIIPHYRDFERLLLLLHSLENQTLCYNKWEVVVVNNDPDIPLVLPETLSLTYRLSILEETKPGSYAARNKGISVACGEIIAFTDSDMIPDSRWLEVAFRYFLTEKKNEIGILTGPVPMYYKNPNNLTPAEIYEKYTGFDFEGYAREGACGAGDWFSFKSVLEEFGGFQETLKSNGDTELSLRISKKYKVVYVPELINRHPARYSQAELVLRFRRILGGTFDRKFKTNSLGFLGHVLNFIFRRYRFALKKMLTVSPSESIAILRVCHSINLGALQEYFDLIRGADTKR